MVQAEGSILFEVTAHRAKESSFIAFGHHHVSKSEGLPEMLQCGNPQLHTSPDTYLTAVFVQTLTDDDHRRQRPAVKSALFQCSSNKRATPGRGN